MEKVKDKAIRMQTQTACCAVTLPTLAADVISIDGWQLEGGSLLSLGGGSAP